MKHSSKIFVLAFVAAVMIGMPCMIRDTSDNSWKRFSKWLHTSIGDVGAVCSLISRKAIYEKEEQQDNLQIKNYKT
jgi:hypothetical protein